MASEDQALKGTEYTGLIWVSSYVMVAFAFLLRSLHAWDVFHVQPLSWKTSVIPVMGLVLVLSPLLMGLAFRKTLKKELGEDLLSERTYRICDFWIA